MPNPATQKNYLGKTAPNVESGEVSVFFAVHFGDRCVGCDYSKIVRNTFPGKGF